MTQDLMSSPLTITERVGNGAPVEPPAQLPPLEPQAPVQGCSAVAMLQGSRGTCSELVMRRGRVKVEELAYNPTE